jgi:predicted PurR-regulated permease PerM
VEVSEPKKSTALISIAAVVVIIYGMQAAKVLLVPFLLAVFLALITVRPMLWMQRRHVPSVFAALLIVFAIMLILAVVGGIIGSSIAEFTAALPSYQARLETRVEHTVTWAVGFLGEDRPVPDIAELIDPGWAMGMAAALLNGVQDVLTNAFLIILTMVFILLEASSMATKAEAAFGHHARSFEQARLYLHNLGRYLGIKTVVSMATGFLAWLVTSLIGLDFPLLWGMLAFLLNYVPTIGSIIAAVPAVLLALVQLGPAEAASTGVGFLVINILFGNLLEPRLMGYGVGISPLIVFTGLVFWGWIFGPVGMLLSVPLTMSLKMAFENNEDSRWIAILIGSERDAVYELKTSHQESADDESAAREQGGSLNTDE